VQFLSPDDRLTTRLKRPRPKTPRSRSRGQLALAAASALPMSLERLLPSLSHLVLSTGNAAATEAIQSSPIFWSKLAACEAQNERGHEYR